MSKIDRKRRIAGSRLRHKGGQGGGILTFHPTAVTEAIKVSFLAAAAIVTIHTIGTEPSERIFTHKG